MTVHKYTYKNLLYIRERDDSFWFLNHEFETLWKLSGFQGHEGAATQAYNIIFTNVHERQVKKKISKDKSFYA